MRFTRTSSSLEAGQDATNEIATSVRFRVCEARPQDAPRLRPFHEWISPDGPLWLAFYRSRDGYRLSFPGLADFHVSSAGHSIRCWPVPGVSDATVGHLYLNQILPLALSRQGKLVFHASAVEIDESGVAFIGASGTGKSTLAASFAASGYGFLTDDALIVAKSEGERWIAPSHPSIRLWDDSHDTMFPDQPVKTPPVQYTPKIRILAGDTVRFCGTRRKLRRVYFLGDGKVQRTTIEPLPAATAMIELVKHSFLLDIEERAMLTDHFRELTQLVERPIYFRLDYPRNFEALPGVRGDIIAHAHGDDAVA